MLILAKRPKLPEVKNSTTEVKYDCDSCSYGKKYFLTASIPCLQGHIMPIANCHGFKSINTSRTNVRKNRCGFCQPGNWFPSGWSFCPKCGDELRGR